MSVSKRTSEIVAAAATVAAVLNGRNYCDAGSIQEARAVFERVRGQYLNETRLAALKTISGATAAALFTAAAIADASVFYVTAATDTTDAALATAKGSAVVSGDVFQRAGAAVQYVGSRTDVTGLDAALAEVAG